MWGKSRILSRVILLTLLFSALVSFLSSAAGSYTPPIGPQTSIVMSISQWNELKQELTEQNLELAQLRQKLKMLRSTSSEQMKLLENLQHELNETQKNLTNASTSLTECQNALKESRESLQTLTKQIKQMEHKQTVMRRQRDVYATLFTLSVGAVIARR